MIWSSIRRGAAMTLRIVVADEGEARFYDFERLSDVANLEVAMRASAHLADPLVRLHDRELASDRPGRKSDRAPIGSGAAASRAGVGGEHGRHEHEIAALARTVVRELEHAHERGAFDQLILVAPPRMLGLLRADLPSRLS